MLLPADAKKLTLSKRIQKSVSRISALWRRGKKIPVVFQLCHACSKSNIIKKDEFAIQFHDFAYLYSSCRVNVWWSVQYNRIKTGRGVWLGGGARLPKVMYVLLGGHWKQASLKVELECITCGKRIFAVFLFCLTIAFFRASPPQTNMMKRKKNKKKASHLFMSRSSNFVINRNKKEPDSAKKSWSAMSHKVAKLLRIAMLQWPWDFATNLILSCAIGDEPKGGNWQSFLWEIHKQISLLRFTECWAEYQTTLVLGFRLFCLRRHSAAALSLWLADFQISRGNANLKKEILKVGLSNFYEEHHRVSTVLEITSSYIKSVQ